MGVVDGIEYGCGETAISITVHGPILGSKRQTPLPHWAGCQPWTAPFVGYEEATSAPSLFDHLSQQDQFGAKRRELMLHMAVNHSVMMEKTDGETSITASSPDEQVAKEGGWEGRRVREGE
ncbi:MAG: hypothetical protein SGPRY_014606 [Prymnesium sp.]